LKNIFYIDIQFICIYSIHWLLFSRRHWKCCYKGIYSPGYSSYWSVSTLSISRAFLTNNGETFSR